MAAKLLKLPVPNLDDARGTKELIGIAKGLPSDQVIRIVCESDLRHIVQEDGVAFESEVEAARRMISDPNVFLSRPLEIILGSAGPTPYPTFQMSVNAYEKKQQLLADFGDYVAALKGSRSIQSDAMMIADEFYTNGSKNAWPAGSALFSGPPSRGGTIDFFAEAREDRFAFGCRDSFGELNVMTVLERIKACLVTGVADAIRHGVGGAGIGSYMVFDACMSYYAGTDPGRQTVVCAVLPLGKSRKTLSGMSKNIHLIA